MNAIKIMSLAVVFGLSVAGCASGGWKTRKVVESAPPSGSPERVFHDQRIKEQLIEAGVKFIKSGDAVPMDILHEQLKRAGCALHLPRPNRERLTVEQIGERCRESVVVVGALYQCCSDSWRLD